MAAALRHGALRIEEDSELTPTTLMAMFAQVRRSRTSGAGDEAQQIIFDSWETDDRRQRVAWRGARSPFRRCLPAEMNRYRVAELSKFCADGR